jgi:hypothetical protein
MFKNKIINERKGAFEGMFAEIGGLKVPLGAGGTHISVTKQSFESNFNSFSHNKYINN